MRVRARGNPIWVVNLEAYAPEYGGQACQTHLIQDLPKNLQDCLFPQLLTEAEIGYAVSSLFLLGSELSTPNPNWQPERLYPNLSWTHYGTLMRVEKVDARAFYVETLKTNCSL